LKGDISLSFEALDAFTDGVYCIDNERRIISWNKSAERLTGFTADEILGARCSDEILVHVDDEGKRLCDSMCPLLDTIEEGSAREVDTYLRHKRGDRIAVKVRTVPLVLTNNTRGGIEIFTEIPGRALTTERIAELEKLAMLDPLTEIANRRHLDQSLLSQLSSWSRYGHPFGILICDIDRFKRVNDTHGHLIGDEVLKKIATTIREHLRVNDLVGRWGGEEFLVIIPQVDEDYLLQVAERLRIHVSEIDSSDLVHEAEDASGVSKHIRVTISVGAALVEEGDTVESLISRADGNLYVAKQSGRNRVTPPVATRNRPLIT